VISICILTFNRSVLLGELLRALSRLMFSPLEIIVVDNHSEDDTERVAQETAPGVRYVRTEKNIGASARNLGFRLARGDIVVFLDDDVSGLEDGHLSDLARLFAERPGLGAVNFRIVDAGTGRLCNWAHHRDPDLFENREFPTYEITEGAVAFRKAVVEEAGYYPESFFLSHEGPDLALRMIGLGCDVVYSPLVSVKHCHCELGRKEWYNYYYDTRNCFWFVARNFPVLYGGFHLLRGIGPMLFYSVRDGHCRYWLKGVRDGVWGLKAAMRQRSVVGKRAMAVIRETRMHRPAFARLVKEKIRNSGARL
jgi:GT2 family glycosyltransferase